MGRERADEWGIQIVGRMEMINDLPAEEAWYHNVCYLNFMEGRQPVVVRPEEHILIYRILINKIYYIQISCSTLTRSIFRASVVDPVEQMLKKWKCSLRLWSSCSRSCSIKPSPSQMYIRRWWNWQMDGSVTV